MSKHTPTPWRTEHFPGQSFVVASNGDIVCSSDRQTDAENISNAAHIVRAVNAHDALVEALKLLVRQWNACGPNSDFGRHFSNVRDAAQAALRAAGVEP